MLKIQTVIECNDPAEVAALSIAMGMFAQTVQQLTGKAPFVVPAPANQQGPAPSPLPAEARTQAEAAEAGKVVDLKPGGKKGGKKGAAAATANGAAEPANDNKPAEKQATLNDVQQAAVAWMKAEGARQGVDTSKAFPPELRAAASAIVEKAVGSPLKNLTDIPPDKLNAVVAAFQAA